MYVYLKLMFARLGLQTALFGHSGRVDIPTEFAAVNSEEGFVDILHARASLYALTTDVHDYIRAAAEFSVGPGANLPPTNYVDDYPNEAGPSDDVGLVRTGKGVGRLYYGCVDDSIIADRKGLMKGVVSAPPATGIQEPTWLIPSDEILLRQATLRERLQQWHRAFRKTPSCQIEDETNANLLMQCHIFMIWLDACLSPFETAFDQFVPQFEEILRLAEVFTGCKADRPTFVSAPCLIPRVDRLILWPS